MAGGVVIFAGVDLVSVQIGRQGKEREGKERQGKGFHSNSLTVLPLQCIRYKMLTNPKIHPFAGRCPINSTLHHTLQKR